MRDMRIRSKKKRLIVGGALLAACAVGVTTTNANASWSATTKPGTWFMCEANCQAGGIGPVGKPTILDPNSNFPSQKIGAWTRTVAIQCKVSGTTAGAYLVKVHDAKWAGTWMIAKPNLTTNINDSGFPYC